MNCCRLIVRQAEDRHDARQQDDQRHHAEHRDPLDLVRVTLVQLLQLVVLKAQLVPRMRPRRLHSVVHRE